MRENIGMQHVTINQLAEIYAQELKSHINFCATMLNLMNDIVFILTPCLQLKLANDFAKSYYSIQDEYILNKPLANIKKFPKSLGVVIKKLQLLDHISLPIIRIHTTEAKQPEKKIRWTMSHLLNKKKIPIGIFLLGKIHVEKFNEKRVNYLQSFLDTIIDSVPGDIYWKNTEGVYLGCNNAMVEKANLSSKDDIIGKTDQELWPESTFWRHDQEIILSNKTMRLEETVTFNTGENMYFASIKTPLKDQENKIIGIVGNSLDVTEIVKAKSKAEKANNVKTQFLLHMQHDIKTPISHIIGLTNIIISMENITEKVKEYIGYIKISSERLMDLIVEILQHCDLETTSGANQEWKFNLVDLIKKTIDLNIILIQEKDLNIIINHDNNIAKNLIGCRDKLHRIFINLLDNALKFTSKGTITITTKLIKVLEYPKVIIELTVEDNGIGIPADKYETIFDRFTKLSPSGSNLYKGLGLGLWMVKQLTKDIDGEIYVTSTVGVGSKFKCVFPCRIAFLDKYEDGN